MCYPTFLKTHKAFLEAQLKALQALALRYPLNPVAYQACSLPRHVQNRVVKVEVRPGHQSAAQPAFYESRQGLVWLPADLLNDPKAKATIYLDKGPVHVNLADLAVKKKARERYVSLNLDPKTGSKVDKDFLLKTLERAIEAQSEAIGNDAQDLKGISLNDQGFFTLTPTAKEDERFYWFEPTNRDNLKANLYVLLNLNELKQQITAVKAWGRHNNLPPSLKPLTRFLGPAQDKAKAAESQPEPQAEPNWQVLTDGTRAGATEQRAWVRKALATPDMALLEGPPGSGKTTVILELVLQLIARGKRVLLTSATHVAIDNVLERLLAQKVKGLLAVRIASNPNAITHSQVREELYAENLYKQFAAKTQAHLQTLQAPTTGQKVLEGLVADPKSVELQHFLLNNADLVAGTLVGLLQHPGLKYAQHDTAPFDYLIVDEASKVSLQGFLVPARFAKRWVMVGDNTQLAPYADANELAIAYRDQLGIPEATALELADSLCNAWAFRKDADRCQKHMRKFYEAAASTPAEGRKAELIDKARVLLPSVLELFQEGLAPMLQTGQDFGLNRGVYQNPDTRLVASSWEPRFESLTYQHRMVDELAAIPRAHFYLGKNMLTARAQSNRIKPYLGLLGDVDTAPATWIAYPHRDTGRDNKEEAEKAVATYKRVLATQQGEAKPSVFIICFYQRQRRLIADLLKKAGIDREEVVHTVDSVQGKEADIVLLCFTKYSEDSFFHVPNRLNVALTRAKSRLLLFGPQSSLRTGTNPALVELAQLPTLL